MGSVTRNQACEPEAESEDETCPICGRFHESDEAIERCRAYEEARHDQELEERVMARDEQGRDTMNTETETTPRLVPLVDATVEAPEFTVVRAHAKCRKCGRKGQVGAIRVNTLRASRVPEAANRRAWTLVWDNQGFAHPLVAFCAGCSEPVFAQPIVGKVTAHKCGARCLSSTGHVCECSCGGQNHGVGR